MSNSDKKDDIEEKDKIKTLVKTAKIKFYYGNPENDIIEGTLKTLNTRVLINDKVNLSYEELELAKQYIWDFNLDNKYIKSKSLCCTNIKNKFSITEFIQAINTYLSYISIIRVFKSSIPNIYYIYLDFKNVEYCNIFYNTYQYSNINTIEDDYLIFDEVTEIEYDAFFSSKQKLSKDDTNIIDLNLIKSNSISFSQNEKRMRKFSYEYDINSHGVDDIRICTICLEDIGKNHKKTKLKNDGLIYVLCGHVFHLECFVGLDDNKCPICRYYLSPYNFVTCEYCFQEKDLWICLVCGKIFCGEEGNSQNHRLQHYQESFHLYTQGLGKNNHIIYDFSKNSPVHIWIQNSILNSIKNEEEEKKKKENENKNDKKEDEKEDEKEIGEKDCIINTDSNLNNNNIIDTSTVKNDEKKENKKKEKNNDDDKDKNKNRKKEKEKEKEKENDNKKSTKFQIKITTDDIDDDKKEDDINDIFKSSKEKTEYIISEYNSIISSQLENQRYYFLNEFKRRENKYLIEKQNLEDEIIKAQKELKKLDEEEKQSEIQKKEIFEQVKKKNNNKIELEKELEKTEQEYKVLQKEKNIIDANYMNKTLSIDNQIEKVDEEIKDLNQQLKELNIHINTLNSLEKSDPEGIKNASVGMIIDFSKGNNTKKKKHH